MGAPQSNPVATPASNVGTAPAITNAAQGLNYDCPFLGPINATTLPGLIGNIFGGTGIGHQPCPQCTGCCGCGHTCDPPGGAQDNQILEKLDQIIELLSPEPEPPEEP